MALIATGARMIVAYHAVFTTYGTWLPNDPRGSFSKRIYQEELKALGEIKYGMQDVPPDQMTMSRFHAAAQAKLSCPPFYITDETRPTVAEAFESVVKRLELPVRACAIMNNHVHILIIRTKHRIEYLVNQLKGAATAALKLTRTPWTRGRWKVFLDDEEAVIACMAYIDANPAAAGLRSQQWPFVKRTT
jgi:REP element-mobilizing transposase RayT